MTKTLIHETSPITDAPRLLLLSFHFPPAQTVGALRWERIAPWIAKRGWELDVITAAPGSLDAAARARLCALPAGTRIYGVPTPPTVTHRLHRAVTAIARAFKRRGRGEAPVADRVPSNTPTPSSLPVEEIRLDLRDYRTLRRAYTVWILHAQDLAWSRAAADLGLQLAQSADYMSVVTCGPPHLTHDGGRLVAQRAGLPFIMDLRDPWSIERRLPEIYASPLFFSFSRRYERRAVAQADLVVTNTHALSDAMQKRYPHADVLTVMNGFDSEQIPSSGQRSCFVVAYAGGIYVDRDPRLLFRAVHQVVGQLQLTPDEFRVEMIGQVGSFGGVPLEVIAREEGVERHVRVGPWRPREQALQFLAQASVVVCLPQDNPYAIPSKVFEYMRFDAWLLVLAESGSPVHELLHDTDADIVSPRNDHEITQALKRRYRQFRAGGRARPIATDRRFSQEVQVKPLLSAIASRYGRVADAAANNEPSVMPPLEGAIHADP
jgi:hypothetical protein